jgi:2-dehydro-3-deoxyphosphogluconate aldolase/(4S)-4-hydroxy-2-oxoglutarate aldolase
MLGAMEAGASAVKIFPAHLWSPEALRGLLQALPDLSTIPTGGIEPGDAEGWIAAGALAVGVGSAHTSAADPAPVAAGLRRAVEAGRLRG